MSEGVIREGWLQGIRCEPSPNFDRRPVGTPPVLLVIHSISLPPGEFGSDDIVALFLNRLDVARHPFFAGIRELRVSAHFLIRRDGELIQFVSCDDRAWHAGLSSWRGRERCNDFSIGVELEGCDEVPFEETQYASLDRLIALLAGCYPIVAATGHADIAPGRKTDPGPYFEWGRIVRLPVDSRSVR
jgi:AmpD protein